jgi:hypothetical protein
MKNYKGKKKEKRERETIVEVRTADSVVGLRR